MSDMAKIRDEIEYSITGFDNNCVIDVCEALQAVRRLNLASRMDMLVLPLTTFCMHVMNYVFMWQFCVRVFWCIAVFLKICL